MTLSESVREAAEQSPALVALSCAAYSFTAGLLFGSSEGRREKALALVFPVPALLLLLISAWEWANTKGVRIGKWTLVLPFHEGHERVLEWEKNPPTRNYWNGPEVYVVRWKYLGWGLWKEREVYGWRPADEWEQESAK